MKQTAVVFAYHNVGIKGLSVLLENDIDIKLVLSHEDNPEENVWFRSVMQLAELNDIPVILPDDPNTAEIIKQITALKPDWLFSFYYRHMLSQLILSIPVKGAYNLHGSLLPKYRGRAPINWAVLNGETECGASLHRIEAKPDAGALVDQQAVPILSNDTSHDVFQKVTCAAEVVLMRSLPKLLDGTQQETPLDLTTGSYFGGRKPEDSRIDWSCSAMQIHNLIRAVAPPYPPAFFDINEHRLHILGSYIREEISASKQTRIYWEKNKCYADCIDGLRFQITELTIDSNNVDQTSFEKLFGNELNFLNI